jgi:nicotinate-nucleotide adenylyltransferase
VLEALDLDAVTFAPALRSPHKPTAPEGSPEIRLAMLRAAVEGETRLAVADLELRRPPPSYTVETLRQLAEGDPTAELTLILGADQWRAFGRWKDPGEIRRLARIAVLARAGDQPIPRDPVAGEPSSRPCVEIPVTRLDISSSLIREKVRAGRSIRFLVTDPVRRIIEAESLYR